MSSYNKLNLFCPALILHDICLFFRAPFFDNIIVYKFQFLHVSITGPAFPLSSPPLRKHARCKIPWVQHAWHTSDFLKRAQQSRCYQCHISDVQNLLLVNDFGHHSELLSTNQYTILQSDGSWTLLIWIVYVNRRLAHCVVNNGSIRNRMSGTLYSIQLRVH